VRVDHNARSSSLLGRHPDLDLAPAGVDDFPVGLRQPEAGLHDTENDGVNIDPQRSPFRR
jgi:hypothetical protein